MAIENITRSTGTIKAPLFWRFANGTGHSGTREQLVRVGIPEAWLADLPETGKKRGCRGFFVRGEQVHISVGERGIFRVHTVRTLDAPSLAKRRGHAFASFMQSAVSGGTPS